MIIKSFVDNHFSAIACAWERNQEEDFCFRPFCLLGSSRAALVTSPPQLLAREHRAVAQGAEFGPGNGG
jgi:hypothetical protein